MFKLFRTQSVNRETLRYTQKRRLLMEALEERQMLSISSPWSDIHDHEYVHPGDLSCVGCAPYDPSRDPDFGMESRAGIPESAPPFALEQTFLLNSNPGAACTIYLDFHGHSIPGDESYLWKNEVNPGADIVTPVFSLDADPAFSSTELEMIQSIWQRVAEDFIAFDVNVTTQDSGVEALRRTGSNDAEWGVRVCIGGSSNDWLGSSAGGIAFVGTFSWHMDVPCYVFPNNLANSEKYIANAISHEVGHTLGLWHDGQGTVEYYEGANGWAPIMGTGYYQPLVQWSKGEYPNASNQEDDLAIITSQNNGFSYRNDDHGNTAATASVINVTDGSAVATGIIERNTDIDFFQLTLTSSGTVNLDVVSGTRHATLDVLARIYNSSGTVLYTSGSPDTLDAHFSNIALGAGTYYLSVEGTGKTVNGNVIYSDYGSIGSYTVTFDVLTNSNTVTNTNDSGAGSLRDALMNAFPGDTITFDPALFQNGAATIVLNSQIALYNTEVVIAGPGADLLTIAAAPIPSMRAFVLTECDVTMSGMTMSGMKPNENAPETVSGGIASNDGNLTLNEMKFLDNSALYGGAVHVYGSNYGSTPGSLTVNNSTFTGNRSVQGGNAIYCMDNTIATINGCTVTDNVNIVSYSWSDIRSSVVGTILTISNSTISGNQGRGVSAGELTITNSTVSNNTGGGVSALTLTMDHCTISGNTLEFDPYSGQVSQGGAGVHIAYSQGIPPEIQSTITNSTIENNTVINGSGGGIFNRSQSLLIADSIISGNIAVPVEFFYNALAGGGGIFSFPEIAQSNLGNLTITRCTITDNRVETPQENQVETNSRTLGGGGVLSVGLLTITGSTISDNHVSNWVNPMPGLFLQDAVGGGGILALNEVTIIQSVISDNTSSACGGGILFCPRIDDFNQAILTNTTITGNTAALAGGGVFISSTIYIPTVNLYNTIIAENTNTDIDRFSGVGFVNGFNSLSSFTDWANGSGENDLYDPSKPLFMDATTGDYHLAPDSQAIDAGDNTYAIATGLTLDLAGNPRIMGGTVDIGAYEYDDGTVIDPETPSIVVTTLADTVDEYDGLVSLREAIAYAGTNGLGTVITFDESLIGGTIVLGGQQLVIDKDVSINA
ncbi:MAG: pre-peptidase C-terminal domain-containing protein, partial [Planctomycetaceae bacterium]|nr:pre-peptidase C-terminal domain-containing protein [Planctomycetaceae bacterium]